jgi:hypothetical protein
MVLTTYGTGMVLFSSMILSTGAVCFGNWRVEFSRVVDPDPDPGARKLRTF